MAIFLISFNLFVGRAGSQSNEINKLDSEIESKKEAKKITEQKIRDLQVQIDSFTVSSINAKGQKIELERLSLSLENEVKELIRQSEDLENQLLLYKNEIQKLESEILANTNLLFKLKYSSVNAVLNDADNLEAMVISSAKNSVIVDMMKQSIDAYGKKIVLVDGEITRNRDVRDEVTRNLESTRLKITALEEEIKQYELRIASTSASVSSFQSELNEIEGQIKFMSVEKQRLVEAELARMQAVTQIEQVEIQSGQYYFTGRGRDLVEGHGLGMSQWGAYGMANLGWTYEQILKHYYAGVEIGDYNEPTEIRVTGMSHLYPEEAKVRGYLTMDEYLAGIGEVPNSWPPEAIKAQVVAARTYVMGTCGNRSSCEICGTASCQVYLGGKGKLDFANQTKGKVILHNGNPIVAYYSASHRGHSSALSTVWGSTDRPYIQPISDDAYAAKGYKSCNPYLSSSVWNCPNDQKIETYNWIWRTNGYSLEELTAIFSRDNRLNVGELQSISVQKDIAGRVGKITLKGSLGSKSLTGWDFRTVFNATTPTGDYIYSTEFTFLQQL